MARSPFQVGDVVQWGRRGGIVKNVQEGLETEMPAFTGPRAPSLFHDGRHYTLDAGTKTMAREEFKVVRSQASGKWVVTDASGVTQDSPEFNSQAEAERWLASAKAAGKFSALAAYSCFDGGTKRTVLADARGTVDMASTREAAIADAEAQLKNWAAKGTNLGKGWDMTDAQAANLRRWLERQKADPVKQSTMARDVNDDPINVGETVEGVRTKKKYRVTEVGGKFIIGVEIGTTASPVRIPSDLVVLMDAAGDPLCPRCSEEGQPAGGPNWVCKNGHRFKLSDAHEFATFANVRVGQRVRTNDGREGVVTWVSGSDADVEIDGREETWPTSKLYTVNAAEHSLFATDFRGNELKVGARVRIIAGPGTGTEGTVIRLGGAPPRDYVVLKSDAGAEIQKPGRDLFKV